MGMGIHLGFFLFSIPLGPHKDGENKEEDPGAHMDPMGGQKAQKSPGQDSHDILDHISAANPDPNPPRMPLGGEDKDGYGGFIRKLGQEDQAESGKEKGPIGALLKKVGFHRPPMIRAEAEGFTGFSSGSALTLFAFLGPFLVVE